MLQISTGGYVRHRDRMVSQSVFEDLRNTLIACRWMTGETSRLVIDPYNTEDGWQIVTTTESELLPLLGKRDDGTPAQVVLIDYFPDTGGDQNSGQSRKTELNTLAIDHGIAGEAEFMELGSNLMEQPYFFTLALYAESDAVAMAIMNDLRDRYQGRLVLDDALDLFDFNKTGFNNTSPPVVRMEIDSFVFRQDEEKVAPWEVHLYFGQLRITDYVDAREPVAPLVIGQAGGIQVGHGPPSGPPTDGSIGYLDLDTGDLYEWTP